MTHETTSATIDDTKHAAEIVRSLPPEEREQVLIKDGHITGATPLVEKVQELLAHDKSGGTSGD